MSDALRGRRAPLFSGRNPSRSRHYESKVQPAPITVIKRRIYLIRSEKVMLDADPAVLYEVPTKRLNEAVRRNLDRFPPDFMFQLTREEFENMRSQIATSCLPGGRRYLPYAFTEHGVAMLSSVLRSPRAIQMNILIVRAFVRMRELLASHKELAVRVERLEAAQREHSSVISILAEEIDDMKCLPEPPKRPIGFQIAPSQKS